MIAAPCSTANDLSLSSGAGLSEVEGPPTSQLNPASIPATSEVEEWMFSIRPLTNLSTKCPPRVGESVLGRGVKTGPHGQPSTKCEYFNAKVRHIALDEDNELYLYVD